MATTSRRESARVHVSGVFDGSGAMKLVNYLRGERGADVVVDFADVERFEAFGIDVLLNQLAGLEGAGITVRCCGVPPCFSERLGDAGVPVLSSARHPRWAPWGP